MRRAAAYAACAMLLLAGSASAQSSPDEQARRLLEDGKQYFGKGQYKQALDNFNTIATGFSATDSVDDALLEIGRYHLEVDGDVEKARASFEQVAQRYPQSDGAPGAYYYLGWLTMTRAAGAAELDDALAQFDRIRTLYPRSDWVARAFYASGLVHRKAGRFAEAVEAERRVALEYPTSEAAPAAQFQIGHCLALMGEHGVAMEEYQRVRNRFPESEWAARALDRTTTLYRLYATASPTFAPDPSVSFGAGDVLRDVRAILMTPDRTLWVASDKTRSVVPFDAEGKIGSSIPAENIRALSFSAKGELLVAARSAVRIGPKDIKSFAVPTDKPGVPEPLEDIGAAVITAGGNMLIADGKRNRVYRYDRQFQFLGTWPDGKEREVRRLVLDGEGAVVLLDAKDKTVQVYDESGRLLRSLGGRGTASEFRKPVDVAVDAARNLYVAEEEGPVRIFSPDGRLLGSLASDEVRRPRALTLDPSGAVLVYDDKAQRVIRFK
ncbi:MAG: tetratricopeptide repeat protein [Acidobacteria bacterium]|nr:tetratricopeptide repeat protein [Acidobacteriota bacterium]